MKLESEVFQLPEIAQLIKEDRGAVPEKGFVPNGVARIYNQFPRRYPGGLSQMIEDLPRIAAMGFNVVWLNPIQQTGNGVKGKGETGSLYAMGSDTKFNDDFFRGIENHNEREKLVRVYTQKARKLGIAPIFDFVPHHVGKASELSEIYADYLNREQIGSQKNAVSSSWTDIVAFDYRDPEKRIYVFENLWKPYIQKYIQEYGFVGMRADAITNTNEDLQRMCYDWMKECCKANGIDQTIILGELMARNPKSKIESLKEAGFTHILASGSFYWDYHHGGLPNIGTSLAAQASELQEIIWANEAEQVPAKGGVIGFVGNHDVGTLIGKCLFELNKDAPVFRGYKQQDIISLKLLTESEFQQVAVELSSELILNTMKEKLFRTALGCNGGWYLLAGDEYGIAQKPQVFENRDNVSMLETDKMDLSGHIACINFVLSDMPPSGRGDWASHQRFGEDPTIQIIVRHSATAAANFIVCDNVIVSQYNEELAETILRQCEKDYGTPEKIYFITQNHNVLRYDSASQEFTWPFTAPRAMLRREDVDGLSSDKPHRPIREESALEMMNIGSARRAPATASRGLSASRPPQHDRSKRKNAPKPKNKHEWVVKQGGISAATIMSSEGMFSRGTTRSHNQNSLSGPQSQQNDGEQQGLRKK